MTKYLNKDDLDCDDDDAGGLVKLGCQNYGTIPLLPNSYYVDIISRSLFNKTLQ